MTTPAPEPPPLTWRHHAVALFVTLHVVCITLYALPRPPAVDDDILKHPEVKAEMEQWPPWLVQTGLKVVRGYVRLTEDARRRVTPYVDAVGSTQSWHMFGGTPPRYPLVFLIEVRPEGEKDFVLFQDLNWGTAESRAMNFRHRKVHENLAAWEGEPSWSAYSAHWARRWDEEHPGRPAKEVRITVLRLTTPTPEQVRAGDTDRRPRIDDQRVWVRKP
jgi:hypothetical protein